MKRPKLRLLYFTVILLVAVPAIIWTTRHFSLPLHQNIGQPIDSLNGVKVYYNGKMGNVSGRHLTSDKYNLGLRYQCVEFVKRYYYEHLNHKMPDTYGHAKDYFDPKVKDGQLNARRGLTQYSNPSRTRPKVDDLLVFSAGSINSYGHVAIIAKTSGTEIEVIQQNLGMFGKSRVVYSIAQRGNNWAIENSRIMGWLRKE